MILWKILFLFSILVTENLGAFLFRGLWGDTNEDCATYMAQNIYMHLWETSNQQEEGKVDKFHDLVTRPEILDAPLGDWAPENCRYRNKDLIKKMDLSSVLLIVHALANLPNQIGEKMILMGTLLKNYLKNMWEERKNFALTSPRVAQVVYIDKFGRNGDKDEQVIYGDLVAQKSLICSGKFKEIKFLHHQTLEYLLSAIYFLEILSECDPFYFSDPHPIHIKSLSEVQAEIVNEIKQMEEEDTPTGPTCEADIGLVLASIIGSLSPDDTDVTIGEKFSLKNYRRVIESDQGGTICSFKINEHTPIEYMNMKRITLVVIVVAIAIKSVDFRDNIPRLGSILEILKTSVPDVGVEPTILVPFTRDKGKKITELGEEIANSICTSEPNSDSFHVKPFDTLYTLGTTAPNSILNEVINTVSECYDKIKLNLAKSNGLPSEDGRSVLQGTGGTSDVDLLDPDHVGASASDVNHNGHLLSVGDKTSQGSTVHNPSADHDPDPTHPSDESGSHNPQVVVSGTVAFPSDTGNGSERSSDTKKKDYDKQTPPSITEESERQIQIAIQQLHFAENMAAASMKITEIGMHGLIAAIQINVLKSYIQVIEKSIDHFQKNAQQMIRFESQLQGIYTNSLLPLIVDDDERNPK